MATEDPLEFMRQNIRDHVQSITGSPDLTIGVELAAMIRKVSGFYETIVAVSRDAGEVSRARLGVLLRLLAETRRGNTEGVNPTYLSRCLNVSKNAVSSLLRGLEEQGLIQRVLDPTDHRRFLIRLTEDGHAMIESSAPQQIMYLNALIADLTPDEQIQLLALLVKLHRSLDAHAAEAP